MTPPVPKRRRLNAPSALHKPFKSPFRTPLQGNPNPPETPPSSDGPEPQTHPSTTSAASSFTPRSQDPPHLQPKRLHQTTTPLPSPRRPETHLLRTPYSASATAQISSLRNTIHTLEQATQLLQNPASDAALEDLIYKWRSASRAAAEELYASSRDRVNRMGGVGAWRDREKDQKKKVLEWEEDALHADEGNSDEDEEEEDEEGDEEEEGGKGRVGLEEKELRREAKKEARRAAREQKKWQLEQLQEKKRVIEERMDGGGRFHDDDSFTMDMMLKALSIELEVIGYSKELQQWVG